MVTDSSGSARIMIEKASPLMKASLAMPCLLLLLAALGLQGCWSPPLTKVDRKSQARPDPVVIGVQSVKATGTVQSVDLDARVITVRDPEHSALLHYRVGSNVSNLDRLHGGAAVLMTVAEEITIYACRNDQVASADGLPGAVLTDDARVFAVDRSYRLLTLRFPKGHSETFKIARRIRLTEVQVGDKVAIRPLEVIALRIKR